MMKAIDMRIGIFIIVVVCFAIMVSPLCAFGLTESALDTEVEATPYYRKLTITELYDKVKECRQTLLEARMDVVREANEAKLRLEGLLKSSKHSAQTTEALKKDLDAIKEAQRMLATILSDIVSATAGEGLDAQGNGMLPPGSAAASQGGGAAVNQSAAGTGQKQEAIPSREYLESLVVLYDEKTQQLAKIVDSLNGIAVSGN